MSANKIASCCNRLGLFFPHRFDQDGMYLITGGDDKNVFVLDARPSSNFTCLGFTGEISHLYKSHSFSFLVCGGHYHCPFSFVSTLVSECQLSVTLWFKF